MHDVTLPRAQSRGLSRGRTADPERRQPLENGARRVVGRRAHLVCGQSVAIDPDEVRRLGEDKSFDIAPMRALLGVEPIGLLEGLARTFGSTETTARAG